jgi:hypothetical protein
MAKYFKTFASCVIGETPFGVNRKWDTAGDASIVAIDSLSRLGITGNSYSARMAVLEGVPKALDVEVFSTVRISTIGAIPQFSIRANDTLSASSRTGYSLLLRTDIGRLEVREEIDGSFVTIQTVTGISYDTITDYCIRFRINDTNLKVKFWDSQDAEPSSWDIDINNANISSDGLILFGNTGTTDSIVYFNEIGCDIAGGSAPKESVGNIDIVSVTSQHYSASWSGSGWEVDISVPIISTDAVIIILGTSATFTDTVKTLGGVDLVKLGQNYGSADRNASWYYLANPVAGSQQLIVQHMNVARSGTAHIIQINGELDTILPVRGTIQTTNRYNTSISDNITECVRGDSILSLSIVDEGSFTNIGSEQQSLFNHIPQTSEGTTRFYSASLKTVVNDPTEISYTSENVSTQLDIGSFVLKRKDTSYLSSIKKSYRSWPTANATNYLYSSDVPSPFQGTNCWFADFTAPTLDNFPDGSRGVIVGIGYNNADPPDDDIFYGLEIYRSGLQLFARMRADVANSPIVAFSDIEILPGTRNRVIGINDYDAKNLSLYVNSFLNVGTTGPGAFGHSNHYGFNLFTVGAKDGLTNNVYPFVGKIHSIAVWDTQILSLNTIMNILDLKKTPDLYTNNLLAYYDFTENTLSRTSGSHIATLTEGGTVSYVQDTEYEKILAIETVVSDREWTGGDWLYTFPINVPLNTRKLIIFVFQGGATADSITVNNSPANFLAHAIDGDLNGVTCYEFNKPPVGDVTINGLNLSRVPARIITYCLRDVNKLTENPEEWGSYLFADESISYDYNTEENALILEGILFREASAVPTSNQILHINEAINTGGFSYTTSFIADDVLKTSTWLSTQNTRMTGIGLSFSPQVIDLRNRRATLTVNASQVSEVLTDFPLLITQDTLPSEMLDADGVYPAQSDGGDLIFTTNADGTGRIPCEIVSFVTDADPLNGSAEIWVKVPSISDTVDTTIFVWWNSEYIEYQPTPDAPYGRNAVWSDYEIVTHDGVLDSTGNTISTPAGTPTLVTDQFNTSNGASRFDSNNTDGRLFNLLNSFTYPVSIQAWANVGITGNPRIMSLANSSVNDQQLNLRTGFSDSYAIGIQAWAGVTVDETLVIGSVTEITTDVWRFYNARCIAEDNRNVWLNEGTTIGTSSVSIPVSGIDRLGLGISADASEYGDQPISVGEARVRFSALSDSWLAAEYINQNSPAIFISVGTPITPDLSIPDISSISFPVIFSGLTGLIITGTNFGS